MLCESLLSKGYFFNYSLDIGRDERIDAGWSSPVARQAHNLKVVGSNPTPATKNKPVSSMTYGFFGVWDLVKWANTIIPS